MNTKSQEIIKLDEVHNTTKSTKLGGYFFRTVQNFKSTINWVENPKKAYKSVVLLIIACVLFLAVTIGIFQKGFDKPGYRLAASQGNVAMAASIHNQAVLSEFLKSMASTIFEENPRSISR